MAMLRKVAIALVAACLLHVGSANLHKRQQVVMSAKTHPRLSNVNTDGSSVIMNITFDGVDLSKQSNHSLDAVPFLEFNNFQVMNATSAMESGILNKTDWDCAESSPNFIMSVPSKYGSPGIFNTNAESLHAAGSSKYVDLISFTLKPLQSNITFGFIQIAAWEIDGEDAHNVYQVNIFFEQMEDGAFEAFPVAPRDYFLGWGEKVNYIEVSASTVDEDNDYEDAPWPFCMDDITFEVREKGDDE